VAVYHHVRALTRGRPGGDDLAGRAVPIEMKAGDVLCFNGYLLHASLPNYSDGCRSDTVPTPVLYPVYGLYGETWWALVQYSPYVLYGESG
jgi:hypothetical protein